MEDIWSTRTHFSKPDSYLWSLFREMLSGIEAAAAVRGKKWNVELMKCNYKLKQLGLEWNVRHIYPTQFCSNSEFQFKSHSLFKIQLNNITFLGNMKLLERNSDQLNTLSTVEAMEKKTLISGSTLFFLVPL